MVMVDKISINVSVLSLNVQHNYLIPEDMSISDAITLIAQTISDEYPGVKKSAMGKNRLICASNGKTLDPSFSFKQLGIVSGEKVVLV